MGLFKEQNQINTTLWLLDPQARAEPASVKFIEKPSAPCETVHSPPATDSLPSFHTAEGTCLGSVSRSLLQTKNCSCV